MKSVSFRTTLRSFSVLGGAQFVNLLANVLKMKVAALLLGPTGVGLIGLYSSLFQTAATVTALGVDSAGTRQLASAKSSGGEAGVSRTRRTIVWCGLALAAIGGASFFFGSDIIARIVVDDQSRQSDIAWLSIGVALTVVAASQTAVLTGLHRVGDLAKINIGASVVGASLSVLALWLWREQALVAVVLIAPAFTALFTFIYMTRLSRSEGPVARLPEIVGEVAPLLKIGIYAMSGVIILQFGFLVVRAQVQHQLGSAALGQFQAAWAIGVAYQALVLASMASDYFPRLTALISDRIEARKLINEQTEVGLLICSPLILALLGFAPWVIQVFYSSEFSPAVEVLRWQLVGDLFKMIFYPLGYALFAAGAIRLFSLNQWLSVTVLIVSVFIGIPRIGLPATGISYLLMYLVVVPIPWWSMRRKIGFRFSRAVCWQIVISFTAAAAVVIASYQSNVLGAVFGGVIAALMCVWALVRISMVAGLDGRLGWVTRFGEIAAQRINRGRKSRE